MLARVAVADQFAGPCIQVRLGVLHRLGERRRGRAVQDPHAAPGALGDLDAVQARAFVLAAGADRPDLAGRQRVAADRGPRSAVPA